MSEDTEIGSIEDNNDPIPLDLAEVLKLSAVDTTFFAHQFFPKTVRMGSPPFHRQMDVGLDGPNRLVNILVFRGGAKTSKLRIFGAKRIAFGLSRTIVWVGKSQDHAINSIKWLRRQIEHNRKFADTFQLSQGSKWQDVHIEIKHGIEEHTATVLAFGVTGSVRGVNIDDFRPDLIVLDDVLDEENAATPEQRLKIDNLVYGALKESLAPATEMPEAKMVVLQTPHNREDFAVKAMTDPEWFSMRFGCWTKETEDLPLKDRESAWEERFPADTLRAEKEHAIRRNQLSLFMREKECKITSPESSAFRESWLNYYDLPPDDMYVVLAIDPVPPPSEVAIAKGLKGKDFECLAVLGKRGKDMFLLDYSINKGHDPSWTIAEFFRLHRKWKVKRAVIESIAYQRTLAWLLRQAMEHQKVYVPIMEFVDKRSKFNRILDALNGISSAGHFFVKRAHSEFIEQFQEYPSVSHDDILDAVSIAISEINTFAGVEQDLDKLIAQEREETKALEYRRGAP